MALNELLIISIQTRLKGSLLIGHRKQEPLVVLHNCPWARLRPLLQGTWQGDALGQRMPCGVWGAHACGMPVPGCACMCGTVHPLLELCVPVQVSVCPSGVVDARTGFVCAYVGLCMSIWGCACVCGAVCAHLGLCMSIWGCACVCGAVRARLGFVCAGAGICAHVGCVWM